MRMVNQFQCFTDVYSIGTGETISLTFGEFKPSTYWLCNALHRRYKHLLKGDITTY